MMINHRESDFFNILILLVLFVGVLCNPLLAQSKETFIIATERYPDTAGGKWLAMIYTEAFKRLDIPFEIKFFPSKRAAIMLDQGQIDGNTSRVYSFGETYKNVIRINSPIVWSKFIAYTINPAIRLDGWNSLKNTGYRIEYQLGCQYCEDKLSPFIPFDDISMVGHWSQSLKKLHANRIDVFVGLEADILPALQSDEYKKFGIVEAGILEKVNGYPYVHKKHKNLVPELENIFNEMIKDGLIEKYRLVSY